VRPRRTPTTSRTVGSARPTPQTLRLAGKPTLRQRARQCSARVDLPCRFLLALDATKQTPKPTARQTFAVCALSTRPLGVLTLWTRPCCSSSRAWTTRQTLDCGTRTELCRGLSKISRHFFLSVARLRGLGTRGRAAQTRHTHPDAISTATQTTASRVASQRHATALRLPSPKVSKQTTESLLGTARRRRMAAGCFDVSGPRPTWSSTAPPSRPPSPRNSDGTHRQRTHARDARHLHGHHHPERLTHQQRTHACNVCR
jgi:hypothetical protein